MHCSYEAGILEDPDHTPPEDMWGLIKSPEAAPDTPEKIVITFTTGIPTKVKIGSSGKEVTDAVEIFDTLNLLAREHGIGRIDIVEVRVARARPGPRRASCSHLPQNRLLGLKSRGCYETPAGTILRTAHIALEGLVMDKELRKLRDAMLSKSFSQQLYDG
jgi:argininosuccinate synthase